MPVLVDSNVILDVVYDDVSWGDWSDREMNRYRAEGLFINPVIYAELCAGAESPAEVDQIMTALSIQFVELPRQALFLAAKAFVKYQQRGGVQTSPLADFFIGAQADVLASPILTRDISRYKTYFPDVALIYPDTD